MDTRIHLSMATWIKRYMDKWIKRYMDKWLHVSIATFKNKNIDLSVVTSVATWLHG